MDAIDKVAWLHVERRRVLCARSQRSDAFYLPGGKREPGESDATCLRREVGEELQVMLRPETIRHVGTFAAQAHGEREGRQVRMTCYAAAFDGELRASREIAEFRWLGHADRELCSPAAKVILDALHERGEID